MDSSQIGRIKRRILNRPLFADLYLLTLAANGKDYLDIIHTKYVFFNFHQELEVVGIAKDYNEAVELVQRIVSECYEKNNDTDIRSYLISNNSL